MPAQIRFIEILPQQIATVMLDCHLVTRLTTRDTPWKEIKKNISVEKFSLVVPFI